MIGKRSFCISFLISLLAVLPAMAWSPAGVEPEPLLSFHSSSTTAPMSGSLWLQPRLSREVQVSVSSTSEIDHFDPDAAYNSRHDEYLVVWRNSWYEGPSNIEARGISARGELQPPFIVSTGIHDCWQPSVAYNADDDVYLVVWPYNANGDRQTREIWARVVDRKGDYVTPALRIAGETGKSLGIPRAVWNSKHNQYMVVWSVWDLATFSPTQVVYAELSTTLAKLHETIVASDNQPRDADIAYDPSSDAFLIVWREQYASGDTEILAAQFKGSPGILVDPPGPFVVRSVGERSATPRVATNQNGRYLVARNIYAYIPDLWDRWGVRVDILDATGSWIGELVLWDGADLVRPFVMADPGSVDDYFTLFEANYAVNSTVSLENFGDTFHGAWPLPITADEGLAYACPAGAMGGANSILVYEAIDPSDPQALRHIYARIFSAYPRYLPILLR